MMTTQYQILSAALPNHDARIELIKLLLVQHLEQPSTIKLELK